MGSGVSPLAMTTRSSKNIVARRRTQGTGRSTPTRGAQLALSKLHSRHGLAGARTHANAARAHARQRRLLTASALHGGADRRAVPHGGTCWCC